MPNSSLPKVICLMGPTASGKTQLAIDLVQQTPRLAPNLQLQIISVDSAMVYRGMDIGTAKPSKALLKIAPHQLIDIHDPSEAYSAGQFYRDALQAIHTIHQQGAVPLLVGGTMLYFWVLQQGIAHLPAANTQIRSQIIKEATQKGWPALHQQLIQIDPAIANHIKISDSQRIQRALEVYYLTGKPLSTLQQHHQPGLSTYHVINFVLVPQERNNLHQRIEQRTHELFRQGFIEEVDKLYQRGDLHEDLPAMRMVGYRQIWQSLAGTRNSSTLKESVIIATRQLAKRQLTWLRRWNNAVWLNSEDNCLIEKILTQIATSD